MITLLDLLKKSGETHQYAHLREGALVPLDPGIPGFQEPSRLTDKAALRGKTYSPETVWRVIDTPGGYEVGYAAKDIKEFLGTYKVCLTKKEIEEMVQSEVDAEIFRQINCCMCGSQRCDGSPEWMEGCEKWKRWKSTNP